MWFQGLGPSFQHLSLWDWGNPRSAIAILLNKGRKRWALWTQHPGHRFLWASLAWSPPISHQSTGRTGKHHTDGPAMVAGTGSVQFSQHSSLLCQLPIGPCRLLWGLNHVLLHLLALNTFLKEVQGGEQKWGTPCSGKTGRTGLQVDIFGSQFHEPDPCISLHLEKHENPWWWWLLLVTSRNLLQKICAWLHVVALHPNHTYTDHPQPLLLWNCLSELSKRCLPGYSHFASKKNLTHKVHVVHFF